jgi:hypothetical protein
LSHDTEEKSALRNYLTDDGKRVSEPPLTGYAPAMSNAFAVALDMASVRWAAAKVDTAA